MKKKVVVIGGGFAGALVARELQHTFDLTLFDTKDYFEFTPSILRTIVEPGHLHKIQVRHAHYLPQAQVITEEVLAVTEREVKTKNHSLNYDYLVITSGSTYSTPLKEKNMVLATRGDELRMYAHHLYDAREILIIGGGPVGVELAAEICSHYPEKRLTLVHAKSRLLERSPEKASAYAAHFLHGRGVKLIVGEKVVRHEKQAYYTNTDRLLSADLAFLCTGIAPNFEFLKSHFPVILDERHYVRVNEFLQVEGHPALFAAGDITAIQEEKLAQNAERQAQIVIRNILHREKDQPLHRYISQPKMMIISLGKGDGLLIYKRFSYGGTFPGILKSMIEWKTMRRYR